MTRPLYALDNPPTGPGRDGHKGLWFDRFFDRYSADWSVAETAKRDWIGTVTGACGDSDALERTALDLYRLTAARGGKTLIADCDWHFATGLGLPHPVENGFQWHPTLGVPYLPGAAVKGLVRAWLESWADDADKPDAATLRAWFGSEDKDPRNCKDGFLTGGFVFFDALPLDRPTLAADIMTPHMGKWYEQGGEAQRDPAKATPADWHDPVPVPFLVASGLTLLFAIAPRTSAHADDLPRLLEALEFALDWLGVGAKTAVGYGHFVKNDNQQRKLESAVQDRAEAEKTQVQTALLETLTPELRAVETFRIAFEQAQATGKTASNDPINEMRLAFMREALEWADPAARSKAGELLQSTLNPMTPPKKRKAEFKDAIATLLGSA